MVEKKFLWGAVTILIALSTVVLVVYSANAASAPPPPLLLHPDGSPRVALRSVGKGSATWWPREPQVFNGSFSVMLSTGIGTEGHSTSDFAAIYIGPLRLPLSGLTDDGITFWAYHYNDITPTFQPYVNIVLDNGRTLEGVTSVSVTGDPLQCQTTGAGCLGWPAAEIWGQMEPSGGYYTSFPTDSVLVAAGLSGCILGSPCPLAMWQSKFPTASVIQIQILYGGWTTSGPLTIFIDDVAISDPPFAVVVPLEPETVAAGTAVSPPP